MYSRTETVIAAQIFQPNFSTIRHFGLGTGPVEVGETARQLVQISFELSYARLAQFVEVDARLFTHIAMCALIVANIDFAAVSNSSSVTS